MDNNNNNQNYANLGNNWHGNRLSESNNNQQINQSQELVEQLLRDIQQQKARQSDHSSVPNNQHFQSYGQGVSQANVIQPPRGNEELIARFHLLSTLQAQASSQEVNSNQGPSFQSGSGDKLRALQAILQSSAARNNNDQGHNAGSLSSMIAQALREDNVNPQMTANAPQNFQNLQQRQTWKAPQSGTAWGQDNQSGDALFSGSDSQIQLQPEDDIFLKNELDQNSNLGNMDSSHGGGTGGSLNLDPASDVNWDSVANIEEGIGSMDLTDALHRSMEGSLGGVGSPQGTNLPKPEIPRLDSYSFPENPSRYAANLGSTIEDLLSEMGTVNPGPGPGSSSLKARAEALLGANQNLNSSNFSNKFAFDHGFQENTVTPKFRHTKSFHHTSRTGLGQNSLLSGRQEGPRWGGRAGNSSGGNEATRGAQAQENLQFMPLDNSIGDMLMAGGMGPTSTPVYQRSLSMGQIPPRQGGTGGVGASRMGAFPSPDSYGYTTPGSIALTSPGWGNSPGGSYPESPKSDFQGGGIGDTPPMSPHNQGVVFKSARRGRSPGPGHRRPTNPSRTPSPSMRDPSPSKKRSWVSDGQGNLIEQIVGPDGKVYQGEVRRDSTFSGGTGREGGSGREAKPADQPKKQRQKRGTATDPHSVAARLRRDKISQRMKVLHDLVPHGQKGDVASMLEEAINYVKSLQDQVKSMKGGEPSGSQTSGGDVTSGQTGSETNENTYGTSSTGTVDPLQQQPQDQSMEDVTFSHGQEQNQQLHQQQQQHPRQHPHQHQEWGVVKPESSGGLLDSIPDPLAGLDIQVDVPFDVVDQVLMSDGGLPDHKILDDWDLDKMN